jgi:hypothetical protein
MLNDEQSNVFNYSDKSQAETIAYRVIGYMQGMRQEHEDNDALGSEVLATIEIFRKAAEDRANVLEAMPDTENDKRLKTMPKTLN